MKKRSRPSVGLVVSTIVVLGALVALFLNDGFGWFGHLPGDIAAERDGAVVRIPFTSVVVATIGLAIVVQLLQRWILPPVSAEADAGGAPRPPEAEAGTDPSAEAL